ncbi:MAG: mandelate racemase/muconate lactonizing enzyme family protein [Candidatus Hodarchaeota archaeon]
MTKIAAIETKILETHLVDTDFMTTYGIESFVKPHVMVKITSDSGISGIGEACPLPDYSGETHDTIKLMIDKYYAPLLINNNPFDLEIIHNGLNSHYPANHAAKAAIDMALHDLLGKILDIPVYKLLGGKFHNEVELRASFGIGPPSTVATKAKAAVGRGAKAIKLKVGLDVTQDVETVKSVRELLGDSIPIAIDANAGYSLKKAMKVLKKLEQWDVEYIEQPIAAWDHEGLRLLRKTFETPIMVDESLCTVEDAVVLIRREAADLFGIKLIKHGGIYNAKKIAILAEANNISCVVISPWETQVGQAAGVHLALASPNFSGPHDLGTKELKDDPTKGLQEEKGIIRSPTGPGLGIIYEFENKKSVT